RSFDAGTLHPAEIVVASSGRHISTELATRTATRQGSFHSHARYFPLGHGGGPCLRRCGWSRCYRRAAAVASRALVYCRRCVWRLFRILAVDQVGAALQGSDSTK